MFAVWSSCRSTLDTTVPRPSIWNYMRDDNAVLQQYRPDVAGGGWLPLYQPARKWPTRFRLYPAATKCLRQYLVLYLIWGFLKYNGQNSINVKVAAFTNMHKGICIYKCAYDNCCIHVLSGSIVDFSICVASKSLSSLRFRMLPILPKKFLFTVRNQLLDRLKGRLNKQVKGWWRKAVARQQLRLTISNFFSRDVLYHRNNDIQHSSNSISYCAPKWARK